MSDVENAMLAEFDNPDVVVEGRMAEDIQEAEEKKPVEQAVPEAPKAEEPQKPAETPSYLTQDEPDEPQETKEPVRVPVSELQKERRKRQELERQLAELSKPKETEPEINLDELSELETGQDEYVDRKTLVSTVKKVAQVVAKNVRESTLGQIQQERAAERQAAEVNRQKQVMIQSEAEARKKFADFDTVVQAAIETGTISPDEVNSIRKAPNPGAALYLKSKTILNTLGITVATQQQKTEQPPASPEAEDDDVYRSVFDKAYKPAG